MLTTSLANTPNSNYQFQQIDRQWHQNEYRLFIATPQQPFCRTLYLLDANVHFKQAITLIDQNKPLPQIIGIGYVGEDKYFVPERTFDYTPKAIGKAFEQGGGADNFLQFIKENIHPLISHQFPSKSTHKLFFGHSFGGLFGSYTLVNEAALFDEYILASPSLWWGNGNFIPSPLNIKNQPHHVFITLGEYEAYPDKDPYIDAQRLKRIKQRRQGMIAEHLYQILQNEGITTDFIQFPQKIMVRIFFPRSL